MGSDSGSAENGTTNFIEDWGPDPWGIDMSGSFDPGSTDPGSADWVVPIEDVIDDFAPDDLHPVLIGTPMPPVNHGFA